MKRDMELIRKIALAVEDSPHGFAPRPMQVVGYDGETIGYHMYLMVESGLAIGSNCTNSRSSSPIAILRSLTPKGHDFVDVARDESRWAKAMGIVKEKGGVVTLDLLKDLLTSLMKMAIGLV